MAAGDWPVGSTGEPTIITIMLRPGAAPLHVGAAQRIRSATGDVLTERGFNWEPTPEELAAALPLIKSLVGDMLASEGLGLYSAPAAAPLAPPA